ncbi:hypothetical protein B0O99DRAFT_224217 [Bisporella sp. PMI_857]|nr:hypothetical protein B0O99DRAFT_224217 [Bisporella sp. PMI_857]
MSSSGGLTASPLRPDLAFNWVFLVELLVCGIVTLFFLFYFNRVFATIVSILLRWYTWKWYRVYIDIQALQISLLGGRIFFKGLRYHGNNETILIHSGYVTWRYWLRTVQELRLGHSSIDSPKSRSLDSRNRGDHVDSGEAAKVEEGGASTRLAKLPCRIDITLEGAEWFVYNRSAAYDAIVVGITQWGDGSENADQVPGELPKERSHIRYRNRPGTSEKLSSNGSSVESGQDKIRLKEENTHPVHLGDPDMHKSSFQTETSEKQGPCHRDERLPLILRFLPIHIECKKAAVVLGNENTKSVLITKVDSAVGEIDATASGPLDQYKQLYNFKFQHPVIQMKPNDDYKEDQTAAAVRIKRGTSEQTERKESHVHTHSFFHRQRRRAWHRLQDMVPAFRRSVESFSSNETGPPGTAAHGAAGTNNWQGLSRYLDESEQDDKARWSSIEYATVSTIVDCPEATMSFYWDAVGTVPTEPSHDADTKGTVDINGAVPPEWGIKLSLKGAVINYGPWADRQRADIQRVFFPSLCKDAIPAKKLAPGQARVPTEFKLYIELEDETILRIPMKEESKNWKWAKQADTMDARPGHQKRNGNRNRKRLADKSNAGPEIRPFGWIDIKVGANSTVRYHMDMVAGRLGFSNKLDLDIPSIEVTTSVNHGVLLRSVKNSISCDLSNPLQWNGYHLWTFDINASDLELFIIREHIFLLVDLVDDWASGPPPEYLTFSPFKYMVNLRLVDFKLYLNINDSNIINNPSDPDDNTWIIIFGSVLEAEISIPLDKYRPHRNDISFKVDASNGGLNLHVPPWNTQATFLSNPEIATLKTLAIKGKYQYCATTSADNTDTLLLDVHGQAPTAQLYGFVIRYYLKVKDNYFGDDIRFKTLEEYQEVLRATQEGATEILSVPPHKKSNDLDVILSISADNSMVILPANLYSAKNNTQIEIATLGADLRFTNYYMDLDVTFHTLAFSHSNENDGETTPLSATSSTQVYIDGVNITGNRLFGLPPIEPTYVCNWDFAVGDISGECTTEFFSRLTNAVQALAFSFDDDENALPPTSSQAIHDVTFLRASVASVRVWLHVEEAAFLLSTSRISVTFNDWACSHYSGKLGVQIPDINLACVDAESASRHRSRPQHPVETYALIQTTISISMIQRKLDFVEHRKLQQEHIKRHDQRTHRTDFLLHPELVDDSMLTHVDPPAMSIPPMPAPVTEGQIVDMETCSITSPKSFLVGKPRLNGRKSSFLSLSSSSQHSGTSIVRGQLSQKDGEWAYTDSRSRTLHSGAEHLPRRRDISTSTAGRPASFYSAIGEHRASAPSSVTFSSASIAPYFPLEGVQPDRRDLPTASFEGDPLELHDQIDLEDIDSLGMDGKATHVSFILEFPTGLIGFLNPKAINAIAGLMSVLNPVEPEDLLDDLQIKAMNEIFGLNKQKIKAGSITDFSVRAPSINLRLISSGLSEPTTVPRRDVHDQYDLSLSQLSAAIRSKSISTKAGIEDGLQESSALQFTLNSATLSAKERVNDTSNAQAAVNTMVDGVLCWAALGEENSGSIVVKAIEVATASSKIEYLATLVHRTTVLADTMGHMFSDLNAKQRNRLQLFTYLVATTGQKAPDPLFLTRPSYVLRSASDHLRTKDSWKIIARFHHMYASLDQMAKSKIAMRCLDNTEIPPEDAKQRMHASFTRWRGWDLNNIHACLILARIYGSDEKSFVPTTMSQPHPIKLSFRTELARLILDPGPKQNEISLTILAVTIESKAAASGAQSTILETFCSDLAISLNWELCELVKDIVKLYERAESSSKPPELPLIAPTSHTNQESTHTLHIIIATEKGSITLDTINIKVVSISKGLKASGVMVRESNSKNMVTIMLAAEAVTSKFKSRALELSLYQLRYPSIYASYEMQDLPDAPNKVVKVAANCQELSFVVLQDILALFEVLDLIIGDEVAQLYTLTKNIPAKASSAQPKQSTSKPRHINRVNVALFLDKYRISLPILQTLVYNVSGGVARASVAAQLDSEVVFDFDIKEHSHDIQTNINDKTQSISLLQMPPTNGRVTTHLSNDETSVAVFASVEPIELDAAAIHSLFTAINRPEISGVVQDIQEDIKGVQRQLKEIFSQEDEHVPRPSPNEVKQFIYEVNLTLAGFGIFASAKSAQAHQNTRLDFNLGCVQLVLANRLDQHGPVLDFPEMRVELRQIMFELARWHNNSMESCGNLTFAAFLTATSKINDSGDVVRSFHLKSDTLEINVFAETASSVVDVISHLQDKIKDLDLSREKNYFRKLRRTKPRIAINDGQITPSESMHSSSVMFASMYSLELLNIQISWLISRSEVDDNSGLEAEDLVLSFKRIDLSTRKENSARLTIEDFQLQMVPYSHDKHQRSLNSALLPEMIFNVGYVSTTDARRFAFQAAGKSLDLRLTSQFIIPAAELQKSIGSAVDKVRVATASWILPANTSVATNTRRKPFFGKKRMESLLVDADFAGAVVYLSGKMTDPMRDKGGRSPQVGRYGQFTHSDASNNTVLRAPGLAWKVEYKDGGIDEPSLNAEVKVDASSNTLYPAVVPLIMEISSAVKEMVSDDDENRNLEQAKLAPQKFMSVDEDNILTADPSTVLGKTRLNLGLRICRQEFSLSCQPIARVTATARFDDIYLTVNTVRSTEHGHFFALSAAITKLQASVQHVYSRGSTGSFDVDSVFLSLMNSKHVSGISGVSAILKISPMKALVNAKQIQDFLLFREIWVPADIRQSPPTTMPASSPIPSQKLLVQRYQQVAATGAFPWNATVSIAELDVQLDLGQALGKSSFMISNFWISSKKNSDWEQNLCLGFDQVGIDSTGRMSGFVTLQDFKLRTSIQWPAREMALNQTPLVQGSLAFSQLRIKAAFDYQAFLVADITSFRFLMYNVRNAANAKGDRLVAILDGESVQVFCTTTTAAQSLALYQAFLRLAQEKKSNYEASLREIEKFMKRRSVSQPAPSPQRKTSQSSSEDKPAKSPISLHTDVIVTLKAVNIGAFPNTFSDHQVFKLEALDAQARFAVNMQNGRIHSILGLTLGQLRIGLAGVKRSNMPTSVGEISVEDVVSNATGSRGGTILKVPKVEATMQTWQAPDSNSIDYIFKSSFEGKVEVGWNYSRISYIRSMWASHTNALAERLGKPLPPSAVKITGVPDEQSGNRKDGEQQKITAEVNVPQSKYNYIAVEPPIIETPQLRDMGEAVSFAEFSFHPPSVSFPEPIPDTSADTTPRMDRTASGKASQPYTSDRNCYAVGARKRSRRCLRQNPRIVIMKWL